MLRSLSRGAEKRLKPRGRTILRFSAVSGSEGMKFRVLGPLEVVVDGVAQPIGGPKRRALLATLLLAAGEPVSRERLIDELWGDEPPSTAANTLQVNVAALRRVLGARLRTQGPGYLLDIAPEQIDSRRFEALNQTAAVHLGSDPEAASRDLVTALELWRGDAFADVPHGEAVSAAAARLDELHLAALEERVEADLALGRHTALVAELTGALESSPVRERLAGQLMLALHRCGRSADALAVFANTCRVLDDQLGVDPGDALTELNRAIHRGDPTLAAPGPASLPVPPTRFIGRVDELARAGELLAGARLLTLSGVGGCGKTRLALELARRAAPGYPGGVHLVDLAPVAPEASVGRQVAAVLGVRERRGATLAALLGKRFRHHRSLLLLDNCEHLAQACAGLCSQLLETAPGLRVLATSREPLGIPSEVLFTVPGLGVPVDDRGENVQAADAVRLLVERARAARSDFSLRPGEGAIAADLCRRLDGLPLAIELAAARLRNLSLREVVAGADERLDALGGSRSIDVRHRTMRASIEWSHDMLDDEERITLRRLSVFAGSFGADAAKTVVGGWPPLLPTTDVLDVCGRLADKSMLVTVPGLEHTRHRLLEIVRQFAAERLAAVGELTSARTRHAAWYYDFVPAARQWAGPDQALWMNRLRGEVDNVHAALAWYLGDGWEADRALEMAGPMWWFWYMGGRVGEGRTWLSRALAATTPEPTAARGLAVRGGAALARITGEFAEALRLGAESLAICRVLGDERGVAAALNNLCITAMVSGDLAAAWHSGEEGLEIITRLGDASGVARSHNNLGVVARIAGDLDHAAKLFAKALDNYRGAGDRRGIAAALSNLAILGRRRGDSERAHELALQAALQLYTELGFDEGQLDCLEVVAAIAADQGDCERALRLLSVAARAREELGAPLFVPDEIAQVRDAEAATRHAVSKADSERILLEAGDMSVHDAVAAVLSAP